MSKQMRGAKEEGERRELGGWDLSRGVTHVYEESDFKAENDFTWDYWDEKNNLYKFFIMDGMGTTLDYLDENIGHVWVDIRCVLRAYELYNLKVPTKSGKVLTKEEDVANALVREGFMKHCTQQLVHQFRMTVKSTLGFLKGLKYEVYLKNRLKNEVIEGVFDKKKIKEVTHFEKSQAIVREGDLVKTVVQPDIIVQYKNGDIDIVSCKCFNSSAYSIAIQVSGCDIRPERDIFQKLHRGEKIRLSKGVVLSKKNHTKIRLVLMLQSTHERTPYEAYKIYNKPKELPSHLYFNKKNIEDGVLKIAKWVKRG